MKATIAVLPGDGIGAEVTREAQLVLEEAARSFGHEFVFKPYAIGGVAIDQEGTPLPDETLKGCLASDAVLLGAVGGPKWSTLGPDRVPESGLLRLRERLGLFANLRPLEVGREAARFSAVRGSLVGGTDILFVRELTGGLYYAEPKHVVQTPQGAVATDTMRYSEIEIRRIARVAFEQARRRGRSVTSVDKANVLATSRLWRQVVDEVAATFPDVTLTHMLVDSFAMRLVQAPRSFDVVVTENTFGDILSDIGGALVGSLGMLASASLGKTGPGLYEPVHGSAPDIAGKGIANPTGAILSAALLLRHSLRLEEEASAVEEAVRASWRTGPYTREFGGVASTVAFGRRVVRALREGAVTMPPLGA